MVELLENLNLFRVRQITHWHDIHTGFSLGHPDMYTEPYNPRPSRSYYEKKLPPMRGHRDMIFTDSHRHRLNARDV